jgi:hypothetical protein
MMRVRFGNKLYDFSVMSLEKADLGRKKLF